MIFSRGVGINKFLSEKCAKICNPPPPPPVIFYSEFGQFFVKTYVKAACGGSRRLYMVSLKKGVLGFLAY